MRVYEFSKESGVASKELLLALQKEGFAVKSHMAVLSAQELDFLKKKFKSSVEEPKQEQKKEAKKETAPEVIKHKEIKKENAPQVVSHAPSKKVGEAEVEKEAKIMQSTAKPVTKSEKNIMLQEKVIRPEKIAEQLSEPVVAEITAEPMTVGEASQKMGKPINEIIVTLLKWGVVANKNQPLAVETVYRLAEHYQIKTNKPAPLKKELITKQAISVSSGEFKERMPVVVVMGHVDHGKTTLLDFIRKTRVAAKEKGGITQHLGAYEAETPLGNIVFLDTPGHEAFTKIRARGMKVADVAVLVIAADDGIMPQTIESIKLAKAMEVPIVVALNKIDKVDKVRLETIKRQLAQQDLLPEDWGGSTVVAPISAKEGIGIDYLLEMILLQSQMMELKADVAGTAKGYVLEAKLEKGRGPVATVISQHGILRIGDYFVSGTAIGKVSSLVNSAGLRIKEAGPSVPVLVAGFESLPEAGDYFEVVPKDQQKKALAKQQDIKNLTPSGSKNYGKENTFNLVIKTDNNSSKEALIDSIEKLSKKSEKEFTVLQAAVGDVSESDVIFAETTSSIIISLHAKVDHNAALLAQREGVEIISFDIIYKLLEALEKMAESAKKVKMVRKKMGEANVLKVFEIKNIGVIAGAYVRDGRFVKDGTVVIYRGSKKVGEGKILSLQRDKKTVKEVHTGFECAFLIEGITDWQQDDRVECYQEVPEK